MDSVNILLLGAGKRVSLCEHFLEAGVAEGVQVRLFGYETSPLVPISSCAKIIVGKKWADPDFESDLRRVIEAHNIHVILPLMDGATVALARLKDRLEKSRPSLWAVASAPKTCEIFFDKSFADEWFASHGVLSPRLKDENAFPQIAKLRTGFGSRGMVRLHNAADAAVLRSRPDFKEYLVQPLIEGTEYTIDAYVSRQGDVVGVVTRIRLEVADGEVSKGVTRREDELIRECARILQTASFEGPVTLQAIKSKTDGRFYFLEINPRFGGGVIHSLKAGANFVRILLREYLGRPTPKVESWQEGLVMMRANREFWTYADHH